MMNTMIHVPQNLHHLLSPLKPPLSFFSSLSLCSKRHSRALSFFPVLASSSSSSYSKRRRNVGYRDYSPSFTRRNRVPLKEGKRRDKGASMEEAVSSFSSSSSSSASRSSSSFDFNKRRAEGNDRSDKLKRIPRRKIRELNPTNTIAYVQILATGMDTQDTSPSVLLFFDKQRFIFNAGEGLQRFCTEHKIRLSKIDHIFLSRVCSETAGGLPGLLLTLAGIGDEGLSVNVWGPSDLKYLVDAMRFFIPRAAMVHTHSFGSTPDSILQPGLNKSGDPIVLVNDIVVKISAILLQPRCPEGSEVKPGEMSVIYLCELPEIMGKFDPKKAMALGLRPGPKYSELQSGKSVKSDCKDIMVHPSDVMGSSVPGPIVLLVDCPTQSHLEELLTVKSLNNYYSSPDNHREGKKIVNCIIHLSPGSVISTPTYQNWMKRFSLAQHIIAGHEQKNMEIPILKASSRIAARLNYLCPQLFPYTGFWSLQDIKSSAINSVPSIKGSDSNFCESISAENLLKFTLRPHTNLGPDRSLIPTPLTASKAINDLLSEIKEIAEVAEDVKQLWNGRDDQIMLEEPWLSANSLPSCLENIRRDDMEMVLLGTGSSQPSKYRNVSSVHINLFSKGGLLLDCGEGTLGQLKRRYGVEGADDAVKNLTCIWISHIHADHHTGLARILALRRNLLKGMPHEPVLVVGPRQLKRYLDAYQRLEDLDMEFLDCRSTTEASWASFEENTEPKHNNNSWGTEGSLFAVGSLMQSVWKRSGSPIENFSAFPYIKKLKRVLTEAGLETLISFPVVHCPQSFGIVLKAAERLNSVGKTIPGWKIVYSGDTRPCPEIIEASRGATVLIHEATFEDGMVEEAVAKNHSTTKEAIEVGSSAGVYRIILTHFSQRYPKIPVINESHMHNTCIAFDLMSVNMADLFVLPKVVPYFKTLFKNEMVEDESDDVADAITEAL